MSRSGEDGYILASATISMIILGALATGILMIAVGELRRVRAEEERVQMMLLYESVAVLTAAELTKEPDARTLRFDDARQTLSIEGVSFDVSLEWESEKLDLNYAELDMIETQAQDLLSHTSHVQALMSQVETARERRAGHCDRLSHESAHLHKAHTHQMWAMRGRLGCATSVPQFGCDKWVQGGV